jgi:hypothetical protein
MVFASPPCLRKKKNMPAHFRHARQQIDRNWRKQGNEPRDKNRPGAMTFEKTFGPF